MKTFLI